MDLDSSLALSDRLTDWSYRLLNLTVVAGLSAACADSPVGVVESVSVPSATPVRAPAATHSPTPTAVPTPRTTSTPTPTPTDPPTPTPTPSVQEVIEGVQAHLIRIDRGATSMENQKKPWNSSIAN